MKKIILILGLFLFTFRLYSQDDPEMTLTQYYQTYRGIDIHKEIELLKEAELADSKLKKLFVRKVKFIRFYNESGELQEVFRTIDFSKSIIQTFYPNGMVKCQIEYIKEQVYIVIKLTNEGNIMYQYKISQPKDKK